MDEHTPEDPFDGYPSGPDNGDPNTEHDIGGHHAPDPMYDSGIFPNDDPLSSLELPEFGVAQFADRDTSGENGELTADIYRAAWDDIGMVGELYSDTPARYPRTDGSSTSDVPSIELQYNAPYGTAKVRRNEYGISIDYHGIDGSVQCNRYTLDSTTQTVYKDTINWAELLKDIPPVGAIPRDMRMRLIAQAENDYQTFADTMGIVRVPVGEDELAHIRTAAQEGNPPTVSYNELRAIMRRRRDAKVRVTDEASYRAIAPLRRIVSAWGAEHPDAYDSDSAPPRIASAADGSPGTLHVIAGYGRAKDAAHESAAVVATLRVPLAEGEVAAWATRAGVPTKVDPSESGRIEIILSLTELGSRVLGEYREKIFDSVGNQVCSEMCLYNADEDDVYKARNLLFDATFHTLED
jgi:hypothetical protein